MKETPEDTSNGSVDRYLIDIGNDLSGLNEVTDLANPSERAGAGGTEHTPRRFAGNLSRFTTIGGGGPLPNHPPQVMTSLRLDDRMTILSCNEARPKGNNNGGIITGGAQVALSQAGIHQDGRAQPDHLLASGINDHRDDALPEKIWDLLRHGPSCGNALNYHLTGIDRLGKGYSAADSGRPFYLRNNHGKPGLIQAMGDPTAQVSSAFNDYQDMTKV